MVHASLDDVGAVLQQKKNGAVLQQKKRGCVTTKKMGLCYNKEDGAVLQKDMVYE